ncbi:cyclase family protein [Pseudosulfitobacter sp. DSM 107133]|uniref:cyclase family protein n=1 Tax=Pseudosulfitobacter sp. DSM 107133 TaxID=2883100 RepID=UPI000DF3E9E0|nr:cyclase family protein [Pseudosulfitobacter sp. DSM 107133]UOA29132.1 Kynurenine formamidase [Pseudosulfitobacter sp. DSM 107133]
MQLIDLSRSLENTEYADPPGLGPKITYFKHDQTAEQILSFFPGVTREQLPGGEGWAVEQVALSTHNGTHLDAPYHYHSTMDGGKPAITIDQVPLEWCIGRGVKLDFRHLPNGHVVTAAEVAAEFERIGHDLAPGDIVLVNTAAGAKYGTPEYVATGCGIGREATNWMTERGMKVCGTDAWSWDAPFVHTAAKVAETGDASLIWEGHRAGMDRAYCHMEKLANLDQLPDSSFEVQCFPVKIKGASAGWARPVAILRNEGKQA